MAELEISSLCERVLKIPDGSRPPCAVCCDAAPVLARAVLRVLDLCDSYNDPNFVGEYGWGQRDVAERIIAALHNESEKP